MAIIKSPCGECSNKGCGIYHDKCPDYQAYRKAKEEEYPRRMAMQRHKEDWAHINQRHWMGWYKNKIRV